MSVHLNRNEEPRPILPPGTSAAKLVFYEPAQPPAVASALSAALGEPYVSLAEGAVLIVRGANFAPTSFGGDESHLRCLYAPVPPTTALFEREFHTTLTRPESLVAPADGGEPEGAVVVPATYVSATLVRCALAPGTALRLGDARVRVAHAARGWTNETVGWSNSSALLTVYDHTQPAVLHRLSPTVASPSFGTRREPLLGGQLAVAYADLATPTTLNVSGSNFAPTADGQLVCEFTPEAGAHAGVAAYVNASFVAPELVRCVAPAYNESGVGDPSTFVRVRVSHAGHDETALSLAALPLLYSDTSTPPIVSAISPNYGPVHDTTRVTLSGWNLAPVEGRLRCRFGAAPWTRGGWRGNATVDCLAPPASYQFTAEAVAESAVMGAVRSAAESAAEATAYLGAIDARRGIGTINAQLSIADGANGSVTNDTSWFVYFDPLAPPRIDMIFTPQRIAESEIPVRLILIASDCA